LGGNSPLPNFTTEIKKENLPQVKSEISIEMSWIIGSYKSGVYPFSKDDWGRLSKDSNMTMVDGVIIEGGQMMPEDPVHRGG
jgi:hypothetical protein